MLASKMSLSGTDKASLSPSAPLDSGVDELDESSMKESVLPVAVTKACGKFTNRT
jgi:hypothetical protein